jgi:hypothetical protein
MSAIGDFVALLMSQGLSADVVRQAVDLAEQHAVDVAGARTIVAGSSPDVVRQSADTSYERKKEYDRKRQAEIRRLKRLAEKDALILTSSSTESKKLTEVESKKEGARTKKRLGPLPDGWRPNPDAHSLAAELGLELAPIEIRFRDYLKSTGKQYADYDAALRTFIRNTPKFSGGRHGNGNRDQSQTGHAAFLAAAARKAERLFGDSELAGAGEAAEFPERDGVDRGRTEPIDITPGRTAGGDRRDEPRSEGVLEGEILAPDKDAHELPDGRFRFG